MKKKIQIYDFDKTLTYRDTFLDFFFFIQKTKYGRQNYFKYFFAKFISIASFLGLITNHHYKNLIARLYLNKINIEEVELLGEEYSKTIELNSLFENSKNNESETRKIIISASPSIYISPLFKDSETEVYGSELKLNHKRQFYFSSNNYAKNKLSVLNKLGIKNIDVFYTDSITDQSLMKITKKNFIVKRSKVLGPYEYNQAIKVLKK